MLFVFLPEHGFEWGFCIRENMADPADQIPESKRKFPSHLLPPLMPAPLNLRSSSSTTHPALAMDTNTNNIRVTRVTRIRKPVFHEYEYEYEYALQMAYEYE